MQDRYHEDRFGRTVTSEYDYKMINKNPSSASKRATKLPDVNAAYQPSMPKSTLSRTMKSRANEVKDIMSQASQRSKVNSKASHRSHKSRREIIKSFTP